MHIQYNKIHNGQKSKQNHLERTVSSSDSAAEGARSASRAACGGYVGMNRLHWRQALCEDSLRELAYRVRESAAFALELADHLLHERQICIFPE